jgi:hypothetical protein
MKQETGKMMAERVHPPEVEIYRMGEKSQWGVRSEIGRRKKADHRPGDQRVYQRVFINICVVVKLKKLVVQYAPVDG